MHILITGMSGTGKSTAIALLRERGFTAIDTDEPEWLVPDDRHDSEWLWDEAKIHHLLERHRGTPLFMAGTRENQGRFNDRFAHVVLLSAPIEVMLDRVTARPTNPFGSRQWEREKIARDLAEFEPILRRGASEEYDTSTMTPDMLVDRLVTLIHELRQI